MPGSRARENYLVAHLENEQAAEIIKTKALLNAHLISLSPNENAKKTFEIFKDYAQILLPIEKKPVNIDNMSPEEAASLKNVLRTLSKPRKKSRFKI